MTRYTEEDDVPLLDAAVKPIEDCHDVFATDFGTGVRRQVDHETCVVVVAYREHEVEKREQKIGAQQDEFP